MKYTLAVVVVVACIFALCAEGSAQPSDVVPKVKDVKDPKEIKDAATASKDVKDAIKNAKEAKKAKKECMKECGQALDPLCAHDPANPSMKPRSFGSQCALNNHNCEMGSHLIMKNKGECPNSGGTRVL